MNADIFDGKWRQIRGRIRQQWGDLNDNDLDKVQGRYDQFVGLLQEKYGYSRKKAESEIKKHLNSANDTWQETSESVSTTASEVTAQAEELMQNNQAALLLVAMVIGFVIGFWTGSSNQS